MGNAGGQPADGGQALGAQHLLLQQRLFLQRPGGIAVGLEQLSEFVAVGIEFGGQFHRLAVHQRAHALGQYGQRLGHAPAPVPVDRQDEGDDQRTDQRALLGQIEKARPEHALAVADDERADVMAAIGNRRGNVEVVRAGKIEGAGLIRRRRAQRLRQPTIIRAEAVEIGQGRHAFGIGGDEYLQLRIEHEDGIGLKRIARCLVVERRIDDLEGAPKIVVQQRRKQRLRQRVAEVLGAGQQVLLEVVVGAKHQRRGNRQGRHDHQQAAPERNLVPQAEIEQAHQFSPKARIIFATSSYMRFSPITKPLMLRRSSSSLPAISSFMPSNTVCMAW